MTNANKSRRIMAGISLMLAPVALLLGMIIDPTPQGGQTEGLAYAAHPEAVGVSATLLHYCWVLLVPGVIGLLHLVRERGRVLANIAGTIAVIGMINLSALMLVDFFESAAYRALPADQAQALIDAAGTPAVVFGWQLPGMFGSLFGLVLVGLAVARARVAGWWFPIGIVLGLALFVFGAQSGTLLLGLAGPVILVITFGAMGLAMIRMNDDEIATTPAPSAVLAA
ncbi:hypothetical protein J5X84_07185 [Streptosporangiaceae bacterium NEAU-GS5]|nr:hypothetical protein [Streptosporangiaceae bacterium NEAU-GS5]